MKGQDINRNFNCREEQRFGSRNIPDHDMMLTDEDSALFKKINEYFRGYFDIEDVKIDPAYSKTRDNVKLMISDYQNNTVHNQEIEAFIRGSLTLEASDAKIIEEINQIKQEISHSNLNDISEEWIKEWQENKNGDGDNNKKTEGIREFITGSLKQAENKAEIKKVTTENKSGSGKVRIIGYASLVAASIIGVFLLIRSFLPFYNPDKIFSRFYEPDLAVSGVTRSLNTIGNEAFESALDSYREGNYQVATAGFSEAILNDPASGSSRFFLGITYIAMNDFSQAVNILYGVANQQGEYSKEARWYLGLAYLKTGNKAKASECFELLAQTSEFYRERSERILRRLK
jgi:TolA-binding protein